MSSTTPSDPHKEHDAFIAQRTHLFKTNIRPQLESQNFDQNMAMVAEENKTQASLLEEIARLESEIAAEDERIQKKNDKVKKAGLHVASLGQCATLSVGRGEK